MRKDWRTKGIIMTARAASDNADTTTEDQAFDLAASALFDDPELIGPALVLLTARSCSVACGPVGRRPRSIRDRGYGPID
jgi:hypothetical protein